MIKNIIYQQREERDSLLNQSYIERIGPSIKVEYLSTGLIKLITGPTSCRKICFVPSTTKRRKICLPQF